MCVYYIHTQLHSPTQVTKHEPQVFTPVDKLVQLEARLTGMEERGQIADKQRLENDFVGSLEECPPGRAWVAQ